METNIQIKSENLNKPATKKQLWALFAVSRKLGQKHDYRNDNLTIKQASELLQRFNAQNVINKVGVSIPTKVEKVSHKARKPTLEQEFLSYMEKRMESIIGIARQAIKIKSVVEDDPKFFPNKKDRQQFAFFGYGCGITIINYDKRSKVGKEIVELSNKHHLGKCLQMFLKGFTAKEINYFKNVGFPLQAMFCQDYQISRKYTAMVASFMESKGVKRVSIRTFDD